PAVDRRDELQATRAEDDGVLPRGPFELCRGRNPEPAGVRPGLLREARRRRSRSQADRTPVQKPGVRAGRVSGCSRGNPAAYSDDGYVLASADAGGVLLRAPLRQDGPVSLRP